MLQIAVSTDELGPSSPPVLNFLKGMRSGLLKIGNQHFDFAGGRFVLSVNQLAAAGADQSMAAKWKSASSQPLTVQTLKPYFVPAAAAGLVLLALAAGYSYVLVPIDQDSQTNANLYAATLERMAQSGPAAPLPLSRFFG